MEHCLDPSLARKGLPRGRCGRAPLGAVKLWSIDRSGAERGSSAIGGRLGTSSGSAWVQLELAESLGITGASPLDVLPSWHRKQRDQAGRWGRWHCRQRQHWLCITGASPPQHLAVFRGGTLRNGTAWLSQERQLKASRREESGLQACFGRAPLRRGSSIGRPAFPIGFRFGRMRRAIFFQFDPCARRMFDLSCAPA